MAINNFFDELTPEQEEMLQLSRQAPMPDGTVFPEQDIMMPEGGMSVDPNMAQPSPLDTILADTRSPMSEMTPDQMMSTPSQSDMNLEEMNLNKVPESSMDKQYVTKYGDGSEKYFDSIGQMSQLEPDLARKYLRGELRGKIYERIKGYSPAKMEAERQAALKEAEPGTGREIASVIGSALMGGAGKVAFADLDEQTRKKKLDIEKKYNLKAGQFEKDVEMMGQLDQNELKSALMTAELNEKELKSKINAQIYSDAQAARDPNSPQSKFAQQIISDGLGIRTNLPASQLTAQVNDASDAIKLKSVLALKNQGAERLQQLKTGQAQQAVLTKEAKIPQTTREFKQLAPEDQDVVKTLAKSNANKISIKNQIDASIAKLKDPNLSDDQKITLGRSLLKTLNSTQGADAIGVEEAKRLGNFLEFKKFNLFEPGSMFGTDLEEFTKQAELTSQSIDEAVKTNQQQINDLYGKAGIQRTETPMTTPKVTPADETTINTFMKNNPNISREKAIQILKDKGFL